MIEARFTRENGKILSYEISGHAYQNKEGLDIVCSAVSALAITACNGIEKLAGATPTVQMSDGYLSVEIQKNLSKEQDTITQLLLKNLEFALQDVASENSRYLKLL